MLRINYTSEIFEIYRSFDEEHRKMLEEFAFQAALNFLTAAEKSKYEKLIIAINLLPEQEQAKIYYMLKGFEVFGKPLAKEN